MAPANLRCLERDEAALVHRLAADLGAFGRSSSTRSTWPCLSPTLVDEVTPGLVLRRHLEGHATPVAEVEVGAHRRHALARLELDVPQQFLVGDERLQRHHALLLLLLPYP